MAKEEFLQEEEYLNSIGFELTTELDTADTIIVNTCGFIKSAKEEAISTILDIAEYKNYQFDLNDFIDIPEDEFAAELLLSTMDLANGERVTRNRVACSFTLPLPSLLC